MRTSSACCCQNICSTWIVGRSAVMHGRYCSFFTRNKSFSRNLHRVCINGKVPRQQFLRESCIKNRVEYRDSILDPRFLRESRIECQLTFGWYCIRGFGLYTFSFSLRSRLQLLIIKVHIISITLISSHSIEDKTHRLSVMV